MNKSNLMASFEVRSYANDGKGEIVQLVIHGKQVVAATVTDGLYEQLFDLAKLKINNAPKPKIAAKPKATKPVKPKPKVAVKRTPKTDGDDWLDGLDF